MSEDRLLGLPWLAHRLQPCPVRMAKEMRADYPWDERVGEENYLAIAWSSFAHPMIPSRAEKNAELNAPIKIKYGVTLI